jgi:membrane fusion protein (multidrug efflux system)
VITIRLSGPGGESKDFTFDAPRVRIGRKEDNDLVIDSKACSRNHAELVRDGGTYKLVDLGSANGIQFESRRVTEVPIRNGTSAVIGTHTLTFLLEETGDETFIMQDDRTEMMPAPAPPAPAAVPAAAAPPPPPAPAPAAASREIYLHFESGRKWRHLKVVSGSEYVIGRAPDADLVLVDKEASLRHAQIASRGDRFSIKDLGSRNGTKVNGVRVDESPIAEGDRIEIGNSLITVSGAKVSGDEAAIMEETHFSFEPSPRSTTAATAAAAATSTAGAEAAGAPAWTRGRGNAKWLAAGLAVIALAGVAYVVFSGSAGSRPPETSPGSGASAAGGTVRVQVAPVARKELVIGVSATGSMKPRQSVTVGTEVPARVLEVPIREGDTVTEGSLLARLNERDIQLQIEEAQSAITQEQVDLARSQYERNQRLFNQGAVTRLQVDQTKNAYLNLDANYRTAQAKIRQLREQIAKAQIKAPITGIVVRKFVNEGELLPVGAPVAAIENMDEMLVDVEVSDRDVVKLRPGQDVVATTDAFSGRTFHGVVDRVASAANPVSRTFNVQARIGNPDRGLKSGMIASLRIVLENKQAVVAPAEALLSDEGGTAKVFAVRDGSARLVDVKVGGRLDREVEIVEGLGEGDEVVIIGKDKLRDGQKVQPYRQQ